jgi:hypothetical protein
MREPSGPAGRMVARMAARIRRPLPAARGEPRPCPAAVRPRTCRLPSTIRGSCGPVLAASLAPSFTTDAVDGASGETRLQSRSTTRSASSVEARLGASVLNAEFPESRHRRGDLLRLVSGSADYRSGVVGAATAQMQAPPQSQKPRAPLGVGVGARADGPTGGRAGGRADGRANGRTGGQAGERTDGQAGERTDGQAGERTDGRAGVQHSPCSHQSGGRRLAPARRGTSALRVAALVSGGGTGGWPAGRVNREGEGRWPGDRTSAEA